MISTYAGIEIWRSDSPKSELLAVAGFLAFTAVILKGVVLSSNGDATDAARTFVRRALADGRGDS